MVEVGYRGQVIARFRSEAQADAYVVRVAEQYGLDQGDMWMKACRDYGNEWVAAAFR